MIKFDFNTYNPYAILKENMEDIYNEFKRNNANISWYNLNNDIKHIKECATKIKKEADVFIVIGIGGSFLGAKAVIEALNSYFKKNKPEVIFAGNDLSSDYLQELLEYITDKNVYLNVISKSGTTLETLFTFNYLFDYLKSNYSDFSKRVIVTTNSHNGKLIDIAQKYHLETFTIPDDLNGRYSVLTNVGLLPIAVAGYDIDLLIEGAKYAKNNLDDCYKYTLIRHNKYLNNKLVESFNVYEPKLYYFTEWLKQLFAESQGKKNKGILPIATLNTRDLHSLGQFFQEGNPILFSTTIFVNSQKVLNVPNTSYTLNDYNREAMMSVAQAHYPHTSTNLIFLDKLDEYHLGYLIFFFEMSAMLGSYLLEVDYYNQPGVKKYKDILNNIIDNNINY